MNRFPPSSQSNTASAFKMPAVSEDGYIRLGFSRLESVNLVHLISGLEEESPGNTACGATSTAIIGYTEWISNTVPAITLGWDWQMETSGNPVSLRRISEPRSNIMLKTGNRDMGPARTAALLEIYIDGLGWEDDVLKYIDHRYS